MLDSQNLLFFIQAQKGSSCVYYCYAYYFYVYYYYAYFCWAYYCYVYYHYDVLIKLILSALLSSRSGSGWVRLHLTTTSIRDCYHIFAYTWWGPSPNFRLLKTFHPHSRFFFYTFYVWKIHLKKFFYLKFHWNYKIELFILYRFIEMCSYIIYWNQYSTEYKLNN